MVDTISYSFSARLWMMVLGCRPSLDDGAGLPPVLGDSAGFRLSNFDSAGLTVAIGRECDVV